MKNIFWLLILMLSGCAGVFVDYKEPAMGPTALLRIDMSPVALVGVYANDKCEKLPEGVFFNGYPNATVIDRQLIDPVGRRIPVKPGLVVSFHTQVIGYQRTENCTISLSFNPEPGAVYEGVSRYVGEKCFASVQRVRVIDGKEVREPEPTLKQTEKTCGVFNNF